MTAFFAFAGADDMKLAAILATAAAIFAGAAQADAVVIKKSKGDNQKLIAGPAFESLQLNVLDDKGLGIGGAEVTFTCTKSPSSPCITIPTGSFKTRTGVGGLAMLTPDDRAQTPKAYEPGVETIRVDVKGVSTTFRVEFVADTAN
jgi:hypothetical protein